jgi:hypothetical protein
VNHLFNLFKFAFNEIFATDLEFESIIFEPSESPELPFRVTEIEAGTSRRTN